jgi:hypothetical protein
MNVEINQMATSAGGVNYWRHHFLFSCFADSRTALHEIVSGCDWLHDADVIESDDRRSFRRL